MKSKGINDDQLNQPYCTKEIFFESILGLSLLNLHPAGSRTRTARPGRSPTTTRTTCCPRRTPPPRRATRCTTHAKTTPTPSRAATQTWPRTENPSCWDGRDPGFQCLTNNLTRSSGCSMLFYILWPELSCKGLSNINQRELFCMLALLRKVHPKSSIRAFYVSA